MRRPGVAALVVLAAGLGGGAAFLARAARLTEPPNRPTRLFEQVFGHIQRFGVDSFPESDLYRRASDGLLRQLDDEYAMLLPEGVTATDAADVGGIGLLLSTRDGRVMVLGVLSDSPAERTGIARGDQLLEVGGRPVDASRRDLLLAALAGPVGGTVRLRLRRPGVAPMVTVDLTRERPRSSVVTPLVTVDSGVGYIGVSLIGPGAAQALEQRLEDLATRRIGRLVLDLRGASLGRLSEAVAMADLFLDRGQVVAQVRGREPQPRRYLDGAVQTDSALHIVVLVDSGTADAGEVVAGALQDNDRALVVGEPTFGRGLSQETFPLNDRMTIRISTARWYTPSGRLIQRDSAATDTIARRPTARTNSGRTVSGGGGIVPDLVVRPDSLPGPQQQLLRAVGGSLPAYHEALRQAAHEVAAAGSVSESYQPSARDRDRLLAELTERKLLLPAHVLEGGAALLDRDLGDEVVRRALGSEALLRRRAGRDPLVRLAVLRLRRPLLFDDPNP